METLDQVVVTPFVKRATDVVEVRWGSGTPLILASGNDEGNADSARGVSS